ncbi:cell wall-binding repeat-containing protein [Desulfitobacterium sp. AusDCA]|uniref:cell wall-binding repeat-containing protein n=1 Tax=Desulfitobacterium sp. AusDCA TaxID=3240383 RepID=UPI003DA75A79
MFNLKSKVHKKIAFTLLTSMATLTLFFSNPSISPSALADSASSQITRLAGSTRYDTALEISKAGWSQAPAVVLARGDDFPDALAGAVLANSSNIKGPLLLTDSASLSAGVLDEIKRLGAQKVYILGGTGAVSAAVEATLQSQNLTVERLNGVDRYQTAAEIAKKAVPQASQAYLASGNSFADALSISSYAASQGIPLLLTEQKTLPQATLDTLKTLGVTNVTLIGGEGVIDPSIQSALQAQNISVTRLSGADRYATNLAILNTLSYDRSSIYVATGEDFPDALAGAVLAGQKKNPILLVPKKAEDLSSSASGYIGVRRIEGASFTLLGGLGVIPFSMESIVRTGSLQSRISLQYLQAYGSNATNYLSEINLIPGQATDSVDWVAPNWYSLNTIPSGQTAADGSFTGPWADSAPDYALVVNSAHSRGLKVLPTLASAWNSDGKAALDSMLSTPASRQNLIQNISLMLKRTGADGIVIDFEDMSDTSGPNLTEFMKELYTTFHAQNKLVVEAVPARTSAKDWNQEYVYHDLVQYVDYLNIMTYDYSMATPGPIAPIDWMKKVFDYTKADGVEMSKVLLGMPYYGRDWTPSTSSTPTNPKYDKTSLGLAGAQKLIADYKLTPRRETSAADSVGIPTFNYTDSSQVVHTVYYDDIQSLETKLNLLDSYNLGGTGAWSLYWVNADTAKVLFPLLQRHLR